LLYGWLPAERLEFLSDKAAKRNMIALTVSV
jgi:hypothetical protein